MNWLEAEENEQIGFEGVNKYFGKRLGGLGA